MKDYPAEIAGMAFVHGENMESAGKCRARHDAIMLIIERLEDKYHATKEIILSDL
jgi:hypothetical protein